jgi:hypothetical protein
MKVSPPMLNRDFKEFVASFNARAVESVQSVIFVTLKVKFVSANHAAHTCRIDASHVLQTRSDPHAQL